MRSLLAIASIHELLIRIIYFIPDFPQSDLDMGIFVELYLGMVVDINIREWVLKLKKSLYGTNKSSENWFDLLKIV